MKLYHGSKALISSLKPQQAQRGEVDVPEQELLNAVYLTPSYEFALAMASRPENSVTHIDGRQITFEKPEYFKPDEDIYIYTVDSNTIPEQNLKSIDELQYAITGLDEVPILELKKTKSRELLEFYELTNWSEDLEPKREISRPFKLS